MTTPLFDPFAPISQQAMQTKLFSGPFTQPPGCEAGRTELPVTMQMNGKLYTFTFRDKIMPEDHYLLGVKAAAFAISRVEEYRGTPPSRTIRDFLIKQNVVI